MQETRLYDPDRGETRSMRSKEEANDYRYFPDPDLLPLVIDEATVAEVRGSLPELPDEKAARFVSEHGLSAYDAGVLTASRELADYYENVVARLGGEPKLAANWVMGELSGALNRDNLDVTQSHVDAQGLAGLLTRIVDRTISGKIAKDVFEAMWTDRKPADAIIDARGLQADHRHVGDRARHRRGHGEEPAAAGRLPLGQGQAVRILRRPGHEGHAGQGESRAVERTAQAQARRVTIAARRRPDPRHSRPGTRPAPLDHADSRGATGSSARGRVK